MEVETAAKERGDGFGAGNDNSVTLSDDLVARQAMFVLGTMDLKHHNN